MPLTPAAQALINQAKVAKPRDYGNLTDIGTLTLLLERNPTWDRDAKLKEWGADDWMTRGSGNSTIDGLASYVKGAIDSVNPTPWKIPESIGDSSGRRIIGNLVGNLTAVSKLPKLLAGLGVGAKALPWVDSGARTIQGGMEGYRDAKENAEILGMELDPKAAITSALGGAALGGGPLGFSKNKMLEGLITGGSILGGAGTVGASNAMQRDESAIGGAVDAMTNPIFLGAAGLGGVVGGLTADGFKMSMGAGGAKGAARAPGAPQATSTAILGGQGAPGANIPPRGATDYQKWSQDAIARALSAEGRAGIEDLGAPPIDRGAFGAAGQELQLLDRLTQIQEALRGIEPRSKAYQGAVYAEPIEGLLPGYSKITGTTKNDALVGDELIARNDLFGQKDQILVSPEGQKLLLGQNWSPLSGGIITEDMLAEELANALGIGRNVRVYGRGVGSNMGQYLAFDPAAGGTPKGYPLPEAALPQTKLANERMTASRAAENKKAGNSIMAGQMQAQGQLSHQRKQEYVQELLAVIAAELEALKGRLQ